MNKKNNNRLFQTVDRSVYIKDIIGMLYLPVTLLLMEMLAKFNIFHTVMDDKLQYLLFLSLAMGFLLSMIAMLLHGRGRRIFYKTTLAVLAVWFSFHVSYYNNFHTFFSWQTLGQAKDVTQFWKEAIVAVGGVWYMVLLFFGPLIIMCLTGRYIVSDDIERNSPYAAIAFTAFVALYFPILVTINNLRNIQYNPS